MREGRSKERRGRNGKMRESGCEGGRVKEGDREKVGGREG